ncbi:MAG: hypothetical protein ACJAYC_001825 [Halieaceae bacterium]|jgi:hypothetical protein
MARVPRTLHYVFGLKQQIIAFHPLHWLAIESARQMLKPDQIILYYHHLPYGYYWDLVRPFLRLVRVELVSEVSEARYDEALVPEKYRYAHHADVIRLDALLEHGGIYADIDTLFLKPLPEAFYAEPFVISEEAPVKDEVSGQMRPSLCNAVMVAEPGSQFVREWRARIGQAINGTWSNHSCLLARLLADEFPDAVRIEPAASLLGVPFTPEGLRDLLENDSLDVADSYCLHLWQHVWWEYERQDFSRVHSGEITLDFLRNADVSLARLARPFLPDVDLSQLGPSVEIN